MGKDNIIADEVYRAMSGLKVCSRCKKDFRPIASEDICCMLPMEVTAMAMARAGIRAAQAGKALNGMIKAMNKIKIKKED